jgi:hypothetical protein
MKRVCQSLWILLTHFRYIWSIIIMHYDGSFDRSLLLQVEGYIQPSIDPHQLRYDPMVRVYAVHWELFYGIIVMHIIINDEMMLHNP